MSVAMKTPTRNQTKPTKLRKSKRDELILAHIPLVKQALGRISSRLPSHVDREDLLESGMVGLVDAAHRYDPTRNIQFSTYAITRIRGAIFDALREEDWLPRSMRNEVSQLEEARVKIQQKTHAPATAKQLSHSLRIPQKKVNKINRIAGHCGINSLSDLPEGCVDQQAGCLHHAHNLEYAPAERAMFAEQKQLLAEAIQNIPANERLVISLYYFEQLNLREIAEILGVTNSRVCQVHRGALRRLQKRLKEPQGLNLMAG